MSALMVASAAVAITLGATHTTAPIIRRIMQNSEKARHPMGKYTRGQSHVQPAWRWISERGLQVATGGATLARYAALMTLNLPEIEDIIPADGSLFLVLRRGAAVSADLRAALTAPLAGMQVLAGTLHEIAVEYGGAAGPDLPALAEQAGMDPATYINSHTAGDYSVAFLGFQPGFPYLHGLPRALQAPRRATPRERVAAGSVAIGGMYTGIYPASGPAGWQIIGRTTAVLFDPQRDAPALLIPGDRVRFVPL
ncbi:MAG TPA: 5-oxoprolinase subunit PxpB [Thiobacillus sp.]|nr:5-oxoprolinase subunit PxpB [Thiobacillus sp.]